MPKQAVHYCYHQPPVITRSKTGCDRPIAIGSNYQTTNKWPDVTCRRCLLNGPRDVKMDAADMTVTQAWYLALIAKHGLVHHRGFGATYAIRVNLGRRGGTSRLHHLTVPGPVVGFLDKAGLLVEDEGKSDWRTGYLYLSPKAQALNPRKTLARLRRQQGPTPNQVAAMRQMDGRTTSLYSALTAYVRNSQYTSTTIKSATVISMLAGGWVRWDEKSDDWNLLLVLTASGRKVLERIAKAEAKAEAGK